MKVVTFSRSDPIVLQWWYFGNFLEERLTEQSTCAARVWVFWSSGHVTLPMKRRKMMTRRKTRWKTTTKRRKIGSDAIV